MSLPNSDSVPPLVLAAHGSRDPASAATMRGLAARVGRVWPAPVVAAFLDFDEPSISDALDALPARWAARPVVVPALLTNAYHGRVDLPGLLAAAAPARLAPVLGPDPLLVSALVRRLSDVEPRATRMVRRAAGRQHHPDGVALLAAGTSDPAARSTVDDMAERLGRRLDLPCVVGYASASGPTAGEAVLALRAAGARRVVAASYFLAPGRLHTAATTAALAAGAMGVAAPLGTADELVRLVIARARLASQAPGRSRVPEHEPGHEDAPVGTPGRAA